MVKILFTHQNYIFKLIFKIIKWIWIHQKCQKKIKKRSKAASKQHMSSVRNKGSWSTIFTTWHVVLKYFFLSSTSFLTTKHLNENLTQQLNSSLNFTFVKVFLSRALKKKKKTISIYDVHVCCVWSSDE